MCWSIDVGRVPETRVCIPGYRGRSALGSSRARCLDVEVSVWLLDIEMPVGLGAWISRLPSDWVPGLAL